ncbi:MAG: hypothetical protein AAFX01_03820 [Cyanobacteria bacterium J06638_28]
MTPPDFPITQLRWWNWNSQEPWQAITLTVPDQDTTHSAYDGVLRRYDVHVAKMFEVAHYFCQQDEQLDGFKWNYEAANGNIFMGQFQISCELARNVAETYGMRRSELTVISFVDIEPDASRDNPYAREHTVPVLNITSNGKIQRWRQYVQTFQPHFPEWVHRLNGKTLLFPEEPVLAQLKGQTTIPILLPREMPGSLEYLLEAGEQCVRADADSYSFSFKPCDSTMRDTLAFSAYVGSEQQHSGEYRPGPRDTFREVELARGIPGAFAIYCGTYCLSRLTWEYQGFNYSISSVSRQPVLVQVANSAINAGER